MLKFVKRSATITYAIGLTLLLVTPSLAQGVKKHIFAREFYKVSDTLYCGSEPTAKEKMVMLKSLGIKTIIDLRLFTGVKEEEQWAKEYGIDYIHISTGIVRPDEQKIKTVMSMVEDPKYQPVYVHCRTGCDRTGVIAGLYRVWNQGWTKEQAYKEMRSHHFRPVFMGIKRSFDEMLANQATKEKSAATQETTSWITQPDSRD
jgi:protein tyrosine/serine phosphatase